jgi:hypothetical protein
MATVVAPDQPRAQGIGRRADECEPRPSDATGNAGGSLDSIPRWRLIALRRGAWSRSRLASAKSDVVLVAELAGHRRLETTRRYSLPSQADRQLAMDGLEVED